MHWFDCFELACRNTLGHQIACINSGNGGDSTVDLLRRIERDCLAHHPDIAFITIGGNDSHPNNGISVTAYRDNLRHIIRQIQACDCHPVVQTYYACDLAAMPPPQAAAFVEMMEAARELSCELACMLIDHLTRWQRLQKSHSDSYRGLMLDAMHVNGTGNLVLGLDIARAFSLSLPDDPYFHDARTTQALLDELASAELSPEGAVCR